MIENDQLSFNLINETIFKFKMLDSFEYFFRQSTDIDKIVISFRQFRKQIYLDLDLGDELVLRYLIDIKDEFSENFPTSGFYSRFEFYTKGSILTNLAFIAKNLIWDCKPQMIKKFITFL